MKPLRPILRCLATAALALLCIANDAAAAEDLPAPPCTPGDGRSMPAGGQASVTLLKGASATAWMPPACTGWAKQRPDVVLAVEGALPDNETSDAILQRLGTVSAMKDIQYWSAARRAWRPLVTEATAIDDGDPARRRRDFSADELQAGREFFVAQTDPELGESIYRFTVLESSAGRVVYEWRNASVLRVRKMAVFGPGDLKGITYIARSEAGPWMYYALLSASSALIRGSEKTLVNRAVALYRYQASIPTDGLPPAME